jgi:hypothetical protein
MFHLKQKREKSNSSPVVLKTNRLYRGEARFQAERLVSPTERSCDLRVKGSPPLNRLRSYAALAIPRKSMRSEQFVLPCWASTERMTETCSPCNGHFVYTQTGEEQLFSRFVSILANYGMDGVGITSGNVTQSWTSSCSSGTIVSAAEKMGSPAPLVSSRSTTSGSPRPVSAKTSV